MELITVRKKLIDVNPEMAHIVAEQLGIDAEEVEYIEKGFTGEIKASNDDERTITALVSTEAIDRDHEVLSISGWQLKNYRKNPVVLFAHKYSEPPVAKSLWVKKDPDGLLAKMQFAETDFANDIYRMYKEKFMKAFSVGFIPFEVKDYSEEEQEAGEPRRRYLKQDLLEYSCVPVPANPEAVVQAMEKGLIKTKTLLDAFGVEDKENKADTYKCECIKCGHKLTSKKHCKDIKCPECGGQMRREERPGPGQEGKDKKPEQKDKQVATTPRRRAGITAEEANDVLDGVIRQKTPEITSQLQETLRRVISELTGKVE